MPEAATKILIIEDDIELCQTLQQNLNDLGNYEVAICHDGKAGLELAVSFQPHIIFLDIMLPGLSGTDVAESLKENPQTEKIPVVFTTGLVQHNEVDRSGTIGGRYYLSKPFHMDDVTAKIREVLNDTLKEGSNEA